MTESGIEPQRDVKLYGS